MAETKTSRLIQIGIKYKTRGGSIIPRLIQFILREYYSMEYIFDKENTIGKNVRFAHNGIGTVIGPTVKIGNNCKIYQNVTLGANRKIVNGIITNEGYPEIEDDVIIYAGAIIVGPVKIGRGSVVGANSVVTEDIPKNSIVHVVRSVVSLKND